MGRIISQENFVSASEINLQRPFMPGDLGIFGNGRWRVFESNGTFIVPAGISRVRVRTVGAGAAGAAGGAGGCGGGYAHGVLAVTAGSSQSVTVGAGGTAPGGAGGTSSFGSLISATGGTLSTPGTGTGGDFQSSGGAGAGASGGGGGGSGSQLGNGGAGTGVNGGGIGGGISPFGGGRNIIGGAPWGRIPAGNSLLSALDYINPTRAVTRFPFDGFFSGQCASMLDASDNPVLEAATLYNHGGGGAGFGWAGGSSAAQRGGIGGGGGGGGTTGAGAIGGIGGGGGGGTSAGNGGPGIVIVEW